MEIESTKFEVDPESLTDGLKKQAAYFSYYSAELVKEQEKMMDITDDIEKKKGDLYMEIRNDYIERGEKVTEKLLENSINQNKDFKTQQSIHSDISKSVLCLKAIMKILDHRMKVLETMSSNKRKELEYSVQL